MTVGNRNHEVSGCCDWSFKEVKQTERTWPQTTMWHRDGTRASLARSPWLKFMLFLREGPESFSIDNQIWLLAVVVKFPLPANDELKMVFGRHLVCSQVPLGQTDKETLVCSGFYSGPSGGKRRFLLDNDHSGYTFTWPRTYSWKNIWSKNSKFGSHSGHPRLIHLYLTSLRTVFNLLSKTIELLSVLISEGHCCITTVSKFAH